MSDDGKDAWRAVGVAVLTVLLAGLAFWSCAPSKEERRFRDRERWARWCANERPVGDCVADAWKLYPPTNQRQGNQ